MLVLCAGAAHGQCELAPPLPGVTQEIRLPVPPAGQAVIGWLHRDNVDWQVELDGVNVPMWPERGGSLPLHAGHDAPPPVLRLLPGPAAASSTPRLTLRCVDAGDPQSERFSAFMALTRRMAVLHKGADPLKGLGLLLDLWPAEVGAAPDPEADRWVAAQRVILARLSERNTERAELARLIRAQAQAQQNLSLAAHASQEIGTALYLQDREQAKAALRQARESFARLGDDYFSTLAQHDLCLQMRLDGALQEALDCYAQVIEEHRAGGEIEGMLRSQLNRSTALSRSGRYAEAAVQLAEAAELIDQAQDRELVASVSRQQAQMLRWRGDFEGALGLLGRLREDYAAAQDNLSLAQTESLIGSTFSLAGEPARAVEYFRSGERHLIGIDHAWRRARLHLSLAMALADLGRHEEAIKAMQLAIAESVDADDAVLGNAMWLALAEIQIQRGEQRAAREALDRLSALGGAQRVSRELLLADLGSDSAGVDWEAELETALANDQVLLAVQIGERWVRQLSVQEQPAQAMKQAQRLVRRASPVVTAIRSPQLRDALLGQLHRLVAALLSQQAAGPMDGELGLALHELLATLARAGMGQPPAAADPDLLLALEKQIGSELVQGAAAPEQGPRSLLLALVGAESAEPAAASKGWSTSKPALHLPAGQRLAIPVFGRASAGLLVSSGSGWSWWPIDRPALTRLRHSLPALLASGHAQDEEIAAQVSALRLALGAERWLDSEVGTLWLGAHRELSALPVELALIGESSLAVGWVLSPESLGLPGPGSLHLLGVAAAEDSGLPELASVQRELDEVAAAWPRLGAAQRASPAQRERLVAALSTPGAVVHLASHGRGSPSRFEESGLWMAGTDQKVDFVSAYRLRGLPVQAGLVVLSACETGLGAGQVGTSLGSVATALGEAGAARVVGARWAVGDRAARVFSAALHQATGGQNAAVEQALERGREALRARPALRNPTHWAGWFVLYRGIPLANGGD